MYTSKIMAPNMLKYADNKLYCRPEGEVRWYWYKISLWPVNAARDRKGCYIVKPARLDYCYKGQSINLNWLRPKSDQKLWRGEGGQLIQ